MLIKAKDIGAVLARFWSGNGWPIITDDVYMRPAYDEVVDFLKTSKTKTLPYVDLLNECEEFALHLLSELRLARLEEIYNKGLDSSKYPNWAFGMCGMSMLHGGEANHMINCAITSDKGLCLIDPQVGGIRPATKGADEIYLLFM